MDKKIYNEIINLPKISETIKYYNLSAIRHMSQNFILDLNITNSIVKTAGNLKKKRSYRNWSWSWSFN